MTKILVFCCFFALLSCQKEVKKDLIKENNSCKKEKKFEMYEMSELATLMERMYAYNMQTRARIIKGDTVGAYPTFFNKIFTAKFTTPSDNDAFFKENAKKYIAIQQKIYGKEGDVKGNFNKGADACIACHQGKCGGPIPRIKKLYIK
ncbi:hypothetical protein [Flavobacterium aciduliphilum]|uniref:Cytochrome c n=1 Tax=Flavobacterium aciduliphilum TaxID=1101402 RepID=A0A328YD61_9FLAO|nr:hypothetical protein [Flavobacterium aciduliphilum]RAR70042.1 hypothetical protein CLV55_11331 [Flavobacterium aciduliphilum]